MKRLGTPLGVFHFNLRELNKVIAIAMYSLMSPV